MRGRTQRVQCFFAMFSWSAVQIIKRGQPPRCVHTRFLLLQFAQQLGPASAALTPSTRLSPHSPEAPYSAHMESLLELCCRRCTWRVPAAPRRSNSVGPITPNHKKRDCTTTPETHMVCLYHSECTTSQLLYRPSNYRAVSVCVRFLRSSP